MRLEMKTVIICSFLVILISGIRLSFGDSYNTIHEQVLFVNSLTSITTETKTIKLYGVSEKYYEDFNEIFYIEDYSAYSLPNEEEMGFNVLMYNGKNIKREYNNTMEMLSELLNGTDVELNKMNNDEYIVYIDKVCVNELLISIGVVTVDRDDKIVAPNTYSTLMLKELEAKNSNTGLWGTSFIVSGVNGQGSSEMGGYLDSLFKISVIFAVIVFVTNFKKNKMNRIIRYGYNILIYTSAMILSIIAGFGISSTLIIGLKEAVTIITLVMIVVLIHYIVNVVIAYKKESVVLMLLSTVLLTLTFIIVFAALYYPISTSERDRISVSYTFPNFEYGFEEIIERPYENYIEIPDNSYRLNQHNNGNQKIYRITPADALYFSTTTYFTVGYGDYQPMGILKVIAMIEMLLSYIMTVIVLAITVGRYSQPVPES